jgi:hypothetical protein
VGEVTFGVSEQVVETDLGILVGAETDRDTLTPETRGR